MRVSIRSGAAGKSPAALWSTYAAGVLFETEFCRVRLAQVVDDRSDDFVHAGVDARARAGRRAALGCGIELLQCVSGRPAADLGGRSAGVQHRSWKPEPDGLAVAGE